MYIMHVWLYRGYYGDVAVIKILNPKCFTGDSCLYKPPYDSGGVLSSG